LKNKLEDMTIEYESNLEIVNVLKNENRKLIKENLTLQDKLTENEKFYC